jgi:hypothetical protein
VRETFGDGLNLFNCSGVIRDSLFSENGNGITVNGNLSGLSVLIDHSEMSFNNTGLLASAGTIRLSNSTISGNGTGINNNGGTVISFRNNVIAGNTVDGAPALSTSLR